MLQINGCVNHLLRRSCHQLIECRLGGGGKVGHRAGDAAQDHDRVAIGNWHHRLDDLGRRCFAQQPDQQWPRLRPAKPTEGAGSGRGDRGVQIVEQRDERRDDGGSWGKHAAAGRGADQWIGMAQQLGQANGRQRRAKPRSGLEGTHQSRALHNPVDDQPDNGLPRLAVVNYRERPQGRSLFENNLLGAITDQPPAQSFKGWDRGGESPASCLSC